MARIELKDVAHSYLKRPLSDSDYALRSLDHVWEDGSACALLGPSGCGKTTFLNVISGLIHPTRGQILFDDREVTELPTEQRNIAQVFQFPVIYDTMTVYDNLAFPLKNRGLDPAQTKVRVEEVAEMLDLTKDLGKRALRLDADVKQKISLGRGLVRSDVAAVLFDEPLTVIDPHLKWQLRRKLKEIHEHSQLTLVYVTHDQNEALTFADQVVVMYEGEVVQVGSPQELFEKPAHTFVGYFIGSPGMNFLPCELNGDGALVEGLHIGLPAKTLASARSAKGQTEIGIRPEFLKLGAETDSGALPVTVSAMEDLGNYKIATVRLGSRSLKVKLLEDQEVAGERSYLTFPPEWTKLYADGALVE